MADRLDLFFTLVPQRDRRQTTDRRRVWRGGRRASDVNTADVLGGSDTYMLTPGPACDLNATAAKLILH